MQENTLRLSRRAAIATAAAGLITCPTELNAQAPTAPITFEVASIKPADPTSHQVRVQMAPGGRLVCNNVNAKFLIEVAYGVRTFQITGGPGWIGTDRFDINAKADGVEKMTPDLLKPMIQAMLEDRFKLKIRRENKELPVYALVTGKNGMKMKEAVGAAEGRSMIRMRRGQITGKQMDMAALVMNLSNQLGRQVIDKTELKGKYDIELNWTPDETQVGLGSFGAVGSPPPPASSETAGPSIFSALQEQLGLKLESQKGPVPMIIVDSIEKPSPD